MYAYGLNNISFFAQLGSPLLVRGQARILKCKQGSWHQIYNSGVLGRSFLVLRLPALCNHVCPLAYIWRVAVPPGPKYGKKHKQ